MDNWDWIKLLPEGSAERREAEALAAELIDLRESNPLQFFEPYPKQEQFLAAREWLKAFFGGNGAGKTAIGIVDDLIQLVDEDVLPDRLRRYKRWQPPFYLRICAPKLAVIDGVILEKLREMTPKGQLRGGSFDKAYDKVNRKLHFANGSWVLFNTYDQDRDAHAGVELHRVHFDEEPEGEHGKGLYTENVARLRRYAPDAQVMFTMTPLFGLSWTFDEVWERRDEDAVFCAVASMLDNPYIDHESMLRGFAHLSEAERRAVVSGEFVAFHGRVLAEFDEDRHVVDPPSLRHVQGLDNVVGIDPGMARGGVLWSGFDRDNVMLSYDELYPSGLPVPALALEIFAQSARWGLGGAQEREDARKLLADQVKSGEITREDARPYSDLFKRPAGPEVSYIIDPSARNRGMTDAERFESLLARCGIFCRHGQNDRRAGIMQLKARLSSNAWLVSRDCVHMLREFQRWVVARDELTEEDRAKGGNRTTGDTFATKGPDHLCDPARYQAMDRLWTEFDVPDPQRRELETYGYGEAPPYDVLEASAPQPDAPPTGAMT